MGIPVRDQPRIRCSGAAVSRKWDLVCESESVCIFKWYLYMYRYIDRYIDGGLEMIKWW